MFKKVIILSIVCFFSLTVITSLIKNSSRNLEKDILKLKRDVYLLEKQVSEAEIDLLWVNGYAYPRLKGGPLYTARYIFGFDKCVYALQSLHRRNKF